MESQETGKMSDGGLLYMEAFRFDDGGERIWA